MNGQDYNKTGMTGFSKDVKAGWARMNGNLILGI